VSLLKPVYVVPRSKPDGYEHTITCNRWWSPRARREAKMTFYVLQALRHPAAREALEETGNREARRKAKIAEKQIRRENARR
jgi:uncharacterized ferritin-like protein (DUF455 family)